MPRHDAPDAGVARQDHPGREPLPQHKLLLVDRLKPKTLTDIIQRDDAPTKIMIVGEAFLAEHGFEGVAMHKIAQAAGQGNKYAVQYYFRDLDGLIDAIVEVRDGAAVLRREELIQIARAKSLETDLRALLEAQLIPFAEYVDAEGRQIGARFWLQYSLRQDFYPPEDPRLARGRAMYFPYTRRIAEAVDMTVDELTKLMMTPVVHIMLGALMRRDAALANNAEVEPLEVVVARAVVMAEAALRAATNRGPQGRRSGSARSVRRS